MPDDHSEEFQWLAFRYVAGEMGGDEAEAFERLLADDPEAQEAVCRTVAVSQRLAEAGPGCEGDLIKARTAPPARGEAGLLARAAKAVAWMAAGATAASIALLLARPITALPIQQGAKLPVAQKNTGPEPGAPAPAAKPDTDPLTWAQICEAGGWSGGLAGWRDQPAPRVETPLSDPAAPPDLPAWVFAVTVKAEKDDKL